MNEFNVGGLIEFAIGSVGTLVLVTVFEKLGVVEWLIARIVEWVTTAEADAVARAVGPRLDCWHDFEDGHTYMMSDGHMGPHEPTADSDIVVRLSGPLDIDDLER